MDQFYKNMLQPDQKIKFGDKKLWTAKNNSVPRKLYKYRPISDWTIQLIKEAMIFHAHKDSFNDPFDGINKFRFTFDENDIIDLVSTFTKDKRKEERDRHINFFISNPQKFEEFVRQAAFSQIGKYGITCFSSKVDNTLMWAHYGDDHKGICIEFNFGEEVKYLDDITELNLFYIRRVNYQNEIPVINYRDIAKERFTPIYHKGKKWEYEDEYRSIRPNVGLFPFHKACLKAIYFGLNSKETDVQTIKEIVLNSNYPNVVFYKMVEQSDSYDLENVPI